MNTLSIIYDMQGWCAYWSAVARRHYELGEFTEAAACQRVAASRFDDLQHEIGRKERDEVAA